MIITIDGYAGSGKTTIARQLADALGFELLNTGGMYRAAAVALGRLGVDVFADPRDETVGRLVESFTFAMPPGRVLLNGMDYTAEVRTEEAGLGASRVGTFPEVRTRLKQEQRRLAADRDVVCEGRDQGTAVFPDAPVKFFLTASPEVRADRRVEQLLAQKLPADRAAVLRQILARDRQDETRAIDPLRAAPDAVRVDTTAMGPDAVLAVMLEAVAKCRARV
jgi:cytidylate kinase